MGWTYCETWQTRTDLENALLNESRATNRLIAHKWVGSNLWIVEKSLANIPTIFVLLTAKHKNYGYGYKDMSEGMHPFYYDCPLDFLEKAPIACQEWRDKVAAFHKNEKVAEMKKKLQVGTVLTLSGCKIPEVRLTSLKPMLGVYDGTVYRVSRTTLRGATIKSQVEYFLLLAEKQERNKMAKYIIKRGFDHAGKFLTFQREGGLATSCLYEVSRELTGTTDEARTGIFDTGDDMVYGDKTLPSFNFSADFDWFKVSQEEFVNELKRRVIEVREAISNLTYTEEFEITL